MWLAHCSVRLPRLHTTMGLRRSIAISLLGTLTLLVALTLAVLRWDTQRNAAQMEQTEAVGDLRRLITSLDARALQVKGILMSWSNWTALYDHVAKPSRSFRAEELTPQTLLVAGADWLALFDLQGSLIDIVEVPQADGSLPATRETYRHAAAYTAYFKAYPQSIGCGTVQAQDALAFVCHSPVLNSDGQGPPMGMIVLGSWIGAPTVKLVSEQTGLEFKLTASPPRAPQAVPVEPMQTAAFRPDAVEIEVFDAHLALRYPILSIFARPIGELQMHWPRRNTVAAEKGLATTQRVVVALMVVCGLLIVVLLDIIVVRRLNRLRWELGQIVDSKDWTGAVSTRGRDEISELAGYADTLVGIVRNQVAELKNLSNTDALTGLPNRRAFNERLAHLLAQQGRQSTATSLVLMDVDYFKRYNDAYGHPAGDAALVRLAECFRATLRRELDMPARLGGEEFGALLEHTDAGQAVASAEKLRAAVLSMALDHRAGLPPGRVTISCGVAEMRSGDTATSLYQRADKALYLAKAAGRNRVVLGE
jgi:diguanylate cyclase (GGDEF)-like protein